MLDVLKTHGGKIDPSRRATQCLWKRHFLLDFLCLGACAKSDAATFFSLPEDFGLFSILPALDAGLLPVTMALFLPTECQNAHLLEAGSRDSSTAGIRREGVCAKRCNVTNIGTPSDKSSSYRGRCGDLGKCYTAGKECRGAKPRSETIKGASPKRQNGRDFPLSGLKRPDHTHNHHYVNWI